VRETKRVIVCEREREGGGRFVFNSSEQTSNVVKGDQIALVCSKCMLGALKCTDVSESQE
jgi:hypothetical protein